jgi:hypothetical protein
MKIHVFLEMVGWSIVMDKNTNSPVEHIIDNRLLHTKKREGRSSFIVTESCRGIIGM